METTPSTARASVKLPDDRKCKTRRYRVPSDDLPPQIEIIGELMRYYCGARYRVEGTMKKRGQVTVFTEKSRKRMLEYVMTVDLSKIADSVFITVTYPDPQLPRTKDERNADRWALIDEIDHYLGRKVYGLWRTEWLPRLTGKRIGIVSPHLHILLFHVNYIPWWTLRQMWQRVIHWDEYVRTEIERPRGRKSTCYYVAKYCGKLPSSSLVCVPYLRQVDGRHWGTIRKDDIPLCPRHWLANLTEEQITAAYDFMRESWPKGDVRRGESFSVFGRAVQRFRKVLKRMPLTKQADCG